MLACSEGNKLAQGMKYLFGWQTEVDNNKAFEIFSQTYEKNEKEIEENELNYLYFFLARCFQNNIGTQIKNEKAVEIYEKAIELGNVNAMYNLAIMYDSQHSRVYKRDIKKAIELYERASKFDHPNALNNLAFVYKYGEEKEGIKKDIHKAIELYERASSLGNKIAIFQLGEIYEKGDVESKLEQDFEKACFLYFSGFTNFKDDYSQQKFIELIIQKRDQIIWRKEYHIYWDKSEKLNQQIVPVLLVSKHRKESKIKKMESVFVKGITMNIIKYLCQYSTIEDN